MPPPPTSPSPLPVTLWRDHAYPGVFDTLRAGDLDTEYRALPAAAFDALLAERDAMRAALDKANALLPFARLALDLADPYNTKGGRVTTGGVSTNEDLWELLGIEDDPCDRSDFTEALSRVAVRIDAALSRGAP